jgi:uncharacterized radical SAM superfamily protein
MQILKKQVTTVPMDKYSDQSKQQTKTQKFSQFSHSSFKKTKLHDKLKFEAFAVES